MRLLELSCDKPSFHNLEFNPEGLTLILGEGTQDDEEEGSSNGVGKTLALCLVHHCLGANTDPRLKKTVPSWRFSLRFEHAGVEHVIERLGNGGGVRIDGETFAQKALRQWLGNAGIFTFEPDIPTLSFRSLLKRFSRVKRDDCVDPIRLNKEPDFEAILRSLYLLGLDCTLAVRKQAIKAELDAIKQTSDSWKNDGLLRDMFRSGAAPQLRAEWLDKEIPRLRGELARFQVAENYRTIQENASKLTLELRELDLSESVLSYRKSMIEKSLVEHPDITRQDLLELYKGIEKIFKPETLAHFEAVEEFHLGLTASRKERLGQDLAGISKDISKIVAQRKAIAKQRDAQLESLQGKRALDEYAAVAKQLAAFDEEHTRIVEFLTFNTRLQERAQEQREARVEQDRAAADYLALHPAKAADTSFKQLAEVMYPTAPSGVLLENNIGDNQIRFNLRVEIEGDDSDGINSARIMCFDWLLLMRGAHHAVDFLWHDNRIFAHVAPINRAGWFAHALNALPGTGKQYIASVNTENYEAMHQYLDADQISTLESTVKLRLSGEKAESKLLGIQFG